MIKAALGCHYPMAGKFQILSLWRMTLQTQGSNNSHRKSFTEHKLTIKKITKTKSKQVTVSESYQKTGDTSIIRHRI